MDYDELIDNSKKLSEEILSKINKLISESRDDEMIKKLNDVKLQVKDIKPNKYNYYKLTELKNGLD